jgi:hypothetical protein
LKATVSLAASDAPRPDAVMLAMIRIVPEVEVYDPEVNVGVVEAPMVEPFWL